MRLALGVRCALLCFAASAAFFVVAWVIGDGTLVGVLIALGAYEAGLGAYFIIDEMRHRDARHTATLNYLRERVVQGRVVISDTNAPENI